MQKKISLVLATVLMVGGLNFTNLSYAHQGYHCEDGVCYSLEGTISPETAKAAAFKHAGVSESSVVMKKCKIDREHGKLVYEIEFYYGNMEYEYDIDATTGAVVKFEKEHK